MRRLAFILLAACHSDVVHTTHAFVATEPCGQGPYEVHLKAQGKMGSEGVEVVACSAHRIAGHVEMIAAGIPMRDVPFGDGADNARCMAGGPIVATAGRDGGGGGGSGVVGGPGTRGVTPTLVEQPAQDNGGLFPDELCKAYGLPGEYLMEDTMTTTDLLQPGADITVKIWSDAPNDLQGVVFLVRHAISTHTRAEEAKEDAEYAKEHAHDPPPPPHHPTPVPDHGAPPPPLAEERPQQPAGGVWIAGYWTWTGTQWGWTSGFWRTDVAMPAPRLEVPGAAPGAGAIWVAGTWQLRAGAWIWIGGRWRR
jgi:hypothetical protein